MQVLPGDVLYLTSDGYTDQNNKEREKIGMDTFINIVAQNAIRPLSEQLIILESHLVNHMGNEQQRDDITI
ncbi:MAG: SpoIIE family protein phosphatase [Bacteroidales bacterium]|nr:SpoIIE family protein phosphatase [Bacteroidales bacterium]